MRNFIKDLVYCYEQEPEKNSVTTKNKYVQAILRSSQGIEDENAYILPYVIIDRVIPCESINKKPYCLLNTTRLLDGTNVRQINWKLYYDGSYSDKMKGAKKIICSLELGECFQRGKDRYEHFFKCKMCHLLETDISPGDEQAIGEFLFKIGDTDALNQWNEKQKKQWNEGITKLKNQYKTQQEQNKELETNGKQLDKNITDLEQQLEEYRSKVKLFSSVVGEEENEKRIPIKAINVDEIHEQLQAQGYSTDKNIVVRFLMALGTNQLIALHGTPGSGKTSFVTHMADILGAKLTMVQVQSNWTDQQDLMGYYNPQQGKFIATPFTDALRAARDDFLSENGSQKLHLICLDEMNLSVIEYYFASFLSLMSMPEKKRFLFLQTNETDKETLLITPNVRFVGTMNIDDTTNYLSPKVVDRSFVIEFKSPDKNEFSDSNNNLEKDAPEEKYFYPLHLFSPEIPAGTSIAYELLSLAPSYRFVNYVKQMAAMREQLGLSDDEEPFFESVILSKILPMWNDITKEQYDVFKKKIKEKTSDLSRELSANLKAFESVFETEDTASYWTLPEL